MFSNEKKNNNDEETGIIRKKIFNRWIKRK